MEAVGSSKTDSEIKQLFYDKLYDTDSGLVGQELSVLQDTYMGTGTSILPAIGAVYR